MNGLKLNQKILVDSSCYFRDEILKLEKTAIADAEKTPQGIRVKMTNTSNWGACPTRTMEQVVATEEDIEKIYNSHVLPRLSGIPIGQGKGKSILLVEDKNFEKGGGLITVRSLKFRESKETMSEGKYDVYFVEGFVGSLTLKVFNNKLGVNVFDDVEEMKEFLFKRIKNSL